MKRTIFILSILALAAILLPAFSIVAQPSHVPHEDPASARASSSSLMLLLFHGDIFDLMASGEYQKSRNLLEQLQYANIAGDLQYIAERLKVLVGDLLTTLDDLEFLLDEAAAQLSQYHIAEARQLLDKAKAALGEAEGMHENIEMAVTALGDRMGVINAPPTSELRQAYNRLQGLLERLQQLLDQLAFVWEGLYTEYESRAGVDLLPTYLTLEVTPESVFVGDSVTVSGRLTDDEGPLGSQQVTVFREGEQIEVTTDGNGFFSAVIVIPYEYVDSTFLEARYLPAGDDVGVYAASKSRRVTVKVTYYRTALRLMVPEIAYPGLPLTVIGEVSSSTGVTERTVTLLLGDARLASMIIEDRFKFDFTLPEETPVGDHVLTAVVAPQERYAGTSQQVDLRVSRLAINVDVQAPSLIVLPRQVRVRGQVYHDLEPLAIARVRIKFGTSPGVSVVTSADGSFGALIEAPLDLSLAGPQKLTVAIEPSEPYYSALTAEKWIVAVNPVGISLMLVGLISVGLLVYRRVTMPVRPGRAAPEVATREKEMPETPTIAPPLRLKRELGGAREKVWEAYLEGLGVVEKVAGVHLGSNNTLREFLRTAASLITVSALSSFAKLTVLTEMTLYSAHEIGEDAVTEARQLAAAIKKEVGDATA